MIFAVKRVPCANVQFNLWVKVSLNNRAVNVIHVFNSNHGIRKAGTLITPRHAVWARHYNMPVNTTLRFVDKNNNVVDRTIAKLKVKG